MRFAVLVATSLVARMAVADDELATTATLDPDPATSPGFTLLDRFDADSRAGADFTYTAADGPRYFFRADVHAHFIDDRYHVGGYAQIQRWHMVLPQPGMDMTGDGTSAPELGALYETRPWLHTALVVRAGATIPTTDPEEFMGMHSQYSRPTDLYQNVRGSGAVRLGVSSITRSGRLFARADLGYDALYKKPEPALSNAVRANVGVGYDRGSVAFMLEVSTLTLMATSVVYDTAVQSTRGHIEMIPSGGLSVRGSLGRLQPYAGVSHPIAAHGFDWAVTFGTDVSI